MSSTTVDAKAGSKSGAKAWRRLLIQPAAVVIIFIGFVIWMANADLSKSASNTLNANALTGFTLEHLLLTFVSAVIVVLIAVPLGIILTRGPMRSATGPVLAVVNVGQAAPSVGIFVLLAFWLGFSKWAAIVALIIYTLLPVLRNTMVGLDGVDARLVEAGRGMGMSAFSVLMRIELPLAVPIMLAGIRTALVLLVGTAALAAFISGGGLGILITTGITLNLPKVLISGALLTALLALLIDWLGQVVEHLAKPKGL